MRHVVVVDHLWGEGDNFFNMEVCQQFEEVCFLYTIRTSH